MTSFYQLIFDKVNKPIEYNLITKYKQKLSIIIILICKYQIDVFQFILVLLKQNR